MLEEIQQKYIPSKISHFIVKDTGFDPRQVKDMNIFENCNVSKLQFS